MCTVLINKYSWTRKTYICDLDFVEMVKAWHKKLTNQSSIIKKIMELLLLKRTENKFLFSHSCLFVHHWGDMILP